MFTQTFAIAKNAFFESVRQPIVFVLLIAATLLLMLASPLSAFTMENDQRMLLDLGLATIFMIGMFLAIFVSSNVLGREIHNKTTLTVVSKPVGRPQFLIGKFIGASSAICLATFYVAIVFGLVELQEVFQTVRVPIHLPVILFGFIAFAIGTGTAIWCNYFYGFVFSSTWICVTTPFIVLAYLLSLNFGPDFSTQPMLSTLKIDLWKAVFAIMVSVVMLGSIAIAVSTRMNQLGTLLATIIIFFIGMMSDAWFGKPMYNLEELWLDRAAIEGQVDVVEETRIMQKTNGDVEEVITEVRIPSSGVALSSYAAGYEYPIWTACKIGSAVVPNFQVLWLTDAITQENVIPNRYLSKTFSYGFLYIIAAVSLGIVLFQRREVH